MEKSMHVYHEQFGEGQVVPSTEILDEEGNVISADVMFEHGIEFDMILAEAATPITGTRLVSKHVGKNGHHAEVRYNRDWNEYSVHHYMNGKHMGEGPVSYHGEGTDGREDATHTAQHETKKAFLKEDEGRKPTKIEDKAKEHMKARGELLQHLRSDGAPKLPKTEVFPGSKKAYKAGISTAKKRITKNMKNMSEEMLSENNVSSDVFLSKYALEHGLRDPGDAEGPQMGEGGSPYHANAWHTHLSSLSDDKHELLLHHLATVARSAPHLHDSNITGNTKKIIRHHYINATLDNQPAARVNKIGQYAQAANIRIHPGLKQGEQGLQDHIDHERKARKDRGLKEEIMAVYESSKSPRRSPVEGLMAAADSMEGGAYVTFRDGETHRVLKEHAKAALLHMARQNQTHDMPDLAARDRQAAVTHSHASMVDAIRESATNTKIPVFPKAKLNAAMPTAKAATTSPYASDKLTANQQNNIRNAKKTHMEAWNDDVAATKQDAINRADEKEDRLVQRLVKKDTVGKSKPVYFPSQRKGEMAKEEAELEKLGNLGPKAKELYRKMATSNAAVYIPDQEEHETKGKRLVNPISEEARSNRMFAVENAITKVLQQNYNVRQQAIVETFVRNNPDLYEQ